MIPYGRQSIDEDDIAAVNAVLRSDWLTTGPEVETFEAALCEYTGARHAVVVSSGTAALHCAYATARIGMDYLVATPSLTFRATANAAMSAGLDVAFADVDTETLCLDIGSVLSAHIVVPVDFAGHPADYSAIWEETRRGGSFLVADACHSLGATYHGRKVGTLADMTALSFHPVKAITTGEGGAILTDSAEYAESLRDFRNHGLGHNYRLSAIACALGRSQLRKLDRFIARRREIAERYLEAFVGLPITLPMERPGVRSAWHLFVIRSPHRDALRKRLADRGVGTQVHYPLVQTFAPWSDTHSVDDTPIARDASAQVMSIPLFPAMTDADVDHVIRAVREVCS